jgi:hypothetical protein
MPTLAPLKERDGGLDLYHLHNFQRCCPVSFDDDDAVAMIHRICDYREQHPHFRNLNSKTAGKLLSVTADERWRCRITQMDAVDDTPEQRQSVRREIDRQRKQRERKANGATPRAQSLSQTKPWLAAGFKCRRTWERHRSHETATPSLPEGWHTERRDRSDGTPRRQRRASRNDDRIREESAGRTLRLSAKPSPSPVWSFCGQAAKTESQQATTQIVMLVSISPTCACWGPRNVATKAEARKA